MIKSIIIISVHISFFFSCSLHAFQIDSNAPGFQCSLNFHSKLTNESGITCSGTYINDRIFVTAAHCFSITDIVAYPNSNYEYYVKCYNQKKKTVKEISIHPQYYQYSLYDKQITMPPRYLDPKFKKLSAIPHNDIAVLLTDPISLAKYAKLPELKSNVPIFYQKDSCRTLGYSPTYCNSKTGKGCYRTNFNLELFHHKSLMDFFCNQETGEGCFSSVKYNENTNKNSPFLINLSSYKTKFLKMGKGDSGSGILCKDKNDNEVLAGIFTLDFVRLNTVNTVNKLNFIKSHIDITEEQFIDLSQQVQISPSLMFSNQRRDNINLLLRRAKHSTLAHTIYINVYGSKFNSVLYQIYKYMIDNPDEFEKILNDYNITWIEGVPDLKIWMLNDKPHNVSFIIDKHNGNKLKFNHNASIREILYFLQGIDKNNLQ